MIVSSWFQAVEELSTLSVDKDIQESRDIMELALLTDFTDMKGCLWRYCVPQPLSISFSFFQPHLNNLSHFILASYFNSLEISLLYDFLYLFVISLFQIDHIVLSRKKSKHISMATNLYWEPLNKIIVRRHWLTLLALVVERVLETCSKKQTIKAVSGSFEQILRM